MPTTPVTHRLTRATLATLATLAFTACSDSSGPSDRVPDAAISEDAAYFVVGELLSSLGSIDPEVAMSTPTMALMADRAAPVRDARAIAARLAVAPEDCGTISPSIPSDTDEDGIPDELTVTYTLPDCHMEDEFGSMDLTGSMGLEDTTPTVAGMSFDLVMNGIRVAITDPEVGSVSVTRNGNGSVAHTAASLTQVHDFSTRVESQGISALFSTEWDLDFDAASGSSIVAGEPLPDGTYAPSGKTVIEQEGARYTFTVSAPEALQYSAACAADEFTYDNPFTSGVLFVEAAGSEGAGWVEVVFSDCLEPTITYYGTNAN